MDLPASIPLDIRFPLEKPGIPSVVGEGLGRGRRYAPEPGADRILLGTTDLDQGNHLNRDTGLRMAVAELDREQEIQHAAVGVQER